MSISARVVDSGQRLRQGFATARAFVRLLGRQYTEDRCRESAAALTYATLFALVPVLTVTYAILAAIPALQEVGGELQEWMLDYFVPEVGTQVQYYLTEFSRQATNLTAVGGAVLLVTALVMLRTIENTMNRIWKVSRPRSGVTAILMYWAVLTLGPLLLGAGLGISSYLTSVAVVADTVEMLGGMRFWLAVLPVFLTTVLLALLYVVVPNCHVPLRQGLIGAFVAALLFELAKGGFALFVRMAPTYEVVYGAFAAVPLFLLWVFLSWAIVLAGAELVRALVIFREQRAEVPWLQALLRVLEVLWRRQQAGELLRSSTLRDTLRDAGAVRWDEVRNLLMDLGLLRRTDEGGYVLTRDLRALTLGELVEQLPWPVREQLATGGEATRPWERALEQRCQRAWQAMGEPLDISLESLFQTEENEGPS